MNVAYGIICHKNSKILNATVRILSKDNDVYIHVDKKSNIEEFYEYKDFAKLMNNRVDVRWGHYSQIECTLNFLKESSSRKKYDYYCILSGDDLPLKTSEDIKLLLKDNKGMQFIGFDKKFNKETLENRVRYIHTDMYFKKDKSNLEKKIMSIRNKFKLFNKNKYYKLMPTLYKGVNWFCISHDCLEYILKYIEENEWYKKAFERSLCGDEVFFHTIIANSIYKDKVYRYNENIDDNLMALRYIDWFSGPEYPKILNNDDFESMKNSGCIFARKFNDNLNIDEFISEFGIVK